MQQLKRIGSDKDYDRRFTRAVFILALFFGTVTVIMMLLARG